MANKLWLIIALAFACIVAVAAREPEPSVPRPPGIPRGRPGHSASPTVRPNESGFNRFWRCLANLPKCNNNPDLVCGTDTRTYINHCVLRKFNCGNSGLKRAHPGKCHPSDVPKTLNNLYAESQRMKGHGSRGRSGDEEEHEEESEVFEEDEE